MIIHVPQYKLYDQLQLLRKQLKQNMKISYDQQAERYI